MSTVLMKIFFRFNNIFDFRNSCHNGSITLIVTKPIIRKIGIVANALTIRNVIIIPQKIKNGICNGRNKILPIRVRLIQGLSRNGLKISLIYSDRNFFIVRKPFWRL
jgi:hypothetical protein